MNHKNFLENQPRGGGIFTVLGSNLFIRYPVNHNKTKIPFSGNSSRT